MNRRRFLGMAGTAAVGAILGGAARRIARASEGVPGFTPAGGTSQGPVVLELIHRPETAPFATDPNSVAGLLDLVLAQALGRGDDLPLDLWSELFPEQEACGVKVAAATAGALTASLAAAVALRMMDADVPQALVTVWDRDETALRALGMKFPVDRSPRLLGAAAEGWGRPLRPPTPAGHKNPTGSGPRSAPRLSKMVERITREATVTPLAATDDGRMGPFVLESLALGATDWKGRIPDGATVARWAADPALAGRGRLHLGDLWKVSLGKDSKGSPKIWDARTILLSTDPVALTAVAHATLSGAREGFGLGPTPASESLAEAARLGLGTAEIDRLTWRKLSF